MPWNLLAGILIGAVVTGCGVLYWLRDRLSAHATPRDRREPAAPARHRAPARRVITRAKTAAEPPREFLDLDSYPPPEPGDSQPAAVPYVAADAPTEVHPAIPA
jgi:uncharacterized iron-regulated membrane protein